MTPTRGFLREPISLYSRVSSQQPLHTHNKTNAQTQEFIASWSALSIVKPFSFYIPTNRVLFRQRRHNS